MNKFAVKFFLIFLSFISILFFSLITFNELQTNRIMSVNTILQDAPPHPPVYIPFILIMILSFIFIFFVVKYINKNFIKPLLQIEDNVKQIKEGSYDVRFTTKSENKEIRDTFSTLNDMTEGLKQKEKLYDNFIQSIVHDLRAPVIAQERAMEVLSEEFEDNSLVKGLVSNNDAFLKMINEIIEAFSQKDTKVEKTHFALSKLVDSVVEALKPSSELKNIKIINRVDSNLTIYADYLSFNRIIANLISNAIENIENNKIITISAKKDNEKVHVVVEDNGAGIKDLNSIFKKYSSLNKSGKKVVSGLGLAIVAELVRKNDGTISAESEENKYTKFIIELPNE